MIGLDVGCGNFKTEGLGIDVLANSQADTLADGMTLPFRDRTFDKIRSSHVIEHTDNPRGFLKEIHRVLKVRGTLILEVPIHSGVLKRALFYDPFLRDVHSRIPALQHKWQFSERGLRSLLKKVGFRIKRLVKPTEPWLYGRKAKFLKFRLRKEYFVEAIKNDNP